MEAFTDQRRLFWKMMALVIMQCWS